MDPANLALASVPACPSVMERAAFFPAAFVHGANPELKQVGDSQAEEVGNLPQFFDLHSTFVREDFAQPCGTVAAPHRQRLILDSPRL